MPLRRPSHMTEGTAVTELVGNAGGSNEVVDFSNVSHKPFNWMKFLVDGDVEAFNHASLDFVVNRPAYKSEAESVKKSRLTKVATFHRL